MIKHYRKFNISVQMYHVVSINSSTGEYYGFNYDTITHNNKKYLIKYAEHKKLCNPVQEIQRLKDEGYKEFCITEIDFSLWDVDMLVSDINDLLK